MYKEPIVEKAEMLPMSIICASNTSITSGGSTSDPGVGGGGETIGD